MKSSTAHRRKVILAAVAPLLGAFASQLAQAAPQGGQVVAGSAKLSGSGNSLVIQQSTKRAIIDWTSFSLDSDQTVKFALPSAMSAVLNRVVSLTPSELNGSIQSNGSVYLINPSGVIVGPHGQIDVQSFFASTLDVSNAAFLAGGDQIFSGPSTATVTNQGTINAAGGNVVLMAQQVQNTGTINAAHGPASLAAGSAVLLQQSSTPHITVRVSGAGSVSNAGLIQSTTAQLAANGGNAMALAINNTGVVRATGVKTAGGHIYLTAGPTGEVSNTGTLDASSTAASGGQIVITGQHILIGSQSHLNADGATGGGEVLIGGSWQNEDPNIPQALGTAVQNGAIIEASATQNGDGGTIVVRSDVANPASFTSVHGSLLALGAGTGNGGRVETSGYSLDATGAAVSTASPHGQPGQWLLDPFNLVITNSTSNFSTSGTPWVPTASGGTIDAATIASALASGDVTISTGSSGGDLGNIDVDAAITKSSGSNTATLELDAANNITITQNITATSGSLNMIFDVHEGTSGAIILGSNLASNGGYIHFGTGRTSNGALVGGDVYFNGTSAQSITTNGGPLVVNGQILIANPDGLTINTAGGDATFQGTVDSGDTYTYVNDSVNWDTALILAKGSTAGGAGIGDTYLATITSSLENTIASNAAGYQQAWLGAHRLIISSTDNQTWRWVTGPEGLEDGGLGLPFFLQNFGTNGGTPINGAFTNWNNGEPNNYGGINTTFNYESVIQFLGTNALWNDLTETNQALPYLVETNLAPSAMTINAAAGHVTFNGLVGTNKALASLTVTGPTFINGGGVTTTGAQTYNNPVTLGSTSTALNVTQGDLNLAQSITYSGSTATSLTMSAFGSVIIATNVPIAANGTGTLSVTADSSALGGTTGAIVMNSGSSITTNGGNAILGGGATPVSSPAIGTAANVNGVALLGATISTGAGNVIINGIGYTGGGSSNPGVLINGGSAITASAGDVAINAGSNLTVTGASVIGGPSTGAVTLEADTWSVASNTQIQGTGALTIFPADTGTSIGVGTSASGTLNLNPTTLATIQPGFASMTFGDSVNTSDIDVEGLTPGTNTNFIAGTGGLTIGAPLNVGSNALSLIAATAATQTAPITAGSLLLQGAGSFTLTNSSNSVGTIAANATGGAIQFTNSGSLTVGTNGSTAGVTDSSAAVTLVAKGSTADLTLAQPVSAAGTGTTVVLAAGRNFINSAGSSAIDPGAGRFLVYSTTPTDDTFDSLTAGNLYGRTYANNPPGSITAAGDQFLYSVKPTLTISAEDSSKVYGQSNPTLTYNVTGLIGGDTSAQAVSGSPLLSTTATASSGVGDYPINTSTGSLTSPLGYKLLFAPGALSVTPAPLTITAQNIAKTYGASLPRFGANYDGLVNGDTSAAVSHLRFSTSATALSSVGGYTVTPSGASAANYNISYLPGTLTITPAPLTIKANDQTRVVNTPNSPLTASYVGLMAGQHPSVIGGVELSTTAQTDSSVGQYPIDITGGVDANYKITLVDGTVSVIEVPVPMLQAQWQLDMALAPNFAPNDGDVPVARIGSTPAAGQAAAAHFQGEMSYRGSLAPRQRAAAKNASEPGAILDNAIVHVSSFDLGGSSGNGR